MSEVVLVALLDVLDLCPECEGRIELELRVVGMLLRRRQMMRR
jgi:hypothetical protein